MHASAPRPTSSNCSSCYLLQKAVCPDACLHIARGLYSMNMYSSAYAALMVWLDNLQRLLWIVWLCLCQQGVSLVSIMAYLCLLACSGFVHNRLATFVLVWSRDCRHGTVNVVVCIAAAHCCVCLLQNMKLVENVQALAQKKGVTASQMALAWLQHQVCRQRSVGEWFSSQLSLNKDSCLASGRKPYALQHGVQHLLQAFQPAARLVLVVALPHTEVQSRLLITAS